MAVGKNELTLELGKHFLIIDSNKSFILEDNQGFRAYRPAGAWQIDCWKLLPEQWHKIYPVYTLKIEWSNSEADKDYIPTINATDLDLGDGIAGVSGQPVNITTPVTVANLPNVIVGEQNTVPVHIETNLQPLEVVNHANNFIDGFKYYSNTFDKINLGSCYVKSVFITLRNGDLDYCKVWLKDGFFDWCEPGNIKFHGYWIRSSWGTATTILDYETTEGYYDLKFGTFRDFTSLRKSESSMWGYIKELD